MVYTTAGMSLARVSVVDGKGAEVFDELVRMSQGVEVMYVISIGCIVLTKLANAAYRSDYNTRFSGIKADEHSKAILDLEGVRRALDSLISADTILVGHALDNDLRALRMVHNRVVDTAILFPHRGGAPFRRKLQDL